MSIKLMSEDGMTFEVDLEVVNHSETLCDMVDIMGVDDDEALPLPEIAGATLEKVIEWCTHEQNKPEEQRFQEEGYNYRSQKDDWTRQYFQVEKMVVFNLLNAANFLNINSLMGWASFTIYEMMEGKTVEEIRQMFNMENDLPVENLEEIEID